MGNKREFKKYVDAVGASACESMMDAYYNIKGADKDAIEKAIARVLGATGAARSNADITFDKGVKAFDSLKDYYVAKKDFFKKLYKKINDDFMAELDAAVKDFNAAIPQEVKDENKAAAK